MRLCLPIIRARSLAKALLSLSFGVTLFAGLSVAGTDLSKITPPEPPVSKNGKVQGDLKPTDKSPSNTIPALTKRDEVTKLYRIKLQWKEATKAALFFHRDIGYLVFNKSGKLSPGTFPSDYFKSLEIIPHNQALIVRFELSGENDILISRQDNEWILVLGKQENEIPYQEYPLKVTPDAGSKTLAFMNDEAEPLVAFQDPHTLDTFWAQPDVNRAVQLHRSLIPLDVLPTQLGVAYLEKDPRHLTVQVDASHHLSLFTLPADTSGTLLTGSAPYDASTHEPAMVSPLVNLSKYDLPSTTIFETTRMMRKDLAIEQDPQKQLQKEIELAKFFLANAYFQEATGIFQLIKERHPQTFSQRDELILMHDIAAILSHAMDDDEFESNVGHFEDEPERHLVRSIHAQRFGNYDEALKGYINALKLIQGLPGPLRNIILLRAMEASVEGKFKKPLFESLIDKHLLTDREADEMGYYKAKNAQMNNPTLSLRETYSRLTFSTNKKIALLAHLALNDGTNTAPKSVLKDLESQRSTWRGDIFEQRLLAVLAGLYQKMGQTEDALNCLRTISVFLWKYQRSHVYQERAEDLFYDTFMAMQDTPVLKQIGFYYAFEDILPRGERFGKIIARLTDLYLAVGLPDQAIDALNQRLKFLNFEKERGTLKDTDHAYLTNYTYKRIAEVALTRSDNGFVLKSLEKISPFPEDPTKKSEYDAFAQEVRLLRAKAHWGQTAYDEVLKDIDGIDTPYTKRLRADVYMAQEKWQEALPILGSLLASSEDQKIKSALDVDAVLDLAVVASHLQNPVLIEALKKDYLDRIEDPEKKQAFDIMVSSPTPIDVTKSKLTAQIEEADNYEKMMAGIKKNILNTTWKDPAIPQTLPSTTSIPSLASPATPSSQAPQAQTADPKTPPAPATEAPSPKQG